MKSRGCPDPLLIPLISFLILSDLPGLCKKRVVNESVLINNPLLSHWRLPGEP